MKKFIRIASLILLLISDWLAFHDFSEPHALRDWLVLIATVLILVSVLTHKRKVKTNL